MGGHRSGMHYRTKRRAAEAAERTTRHHDRDIAYRAALGLGDGPLPAALGSVHHNRPEPPHVGG